MEYSNFHQVIEHDLLHEFCEFHHFKILYTTPHLNAPSLALSNCGKDGFIVVVIVTLHAGLRSIGACVLRSQLSGIVVLFDAVLGVLGDGSIPQEIVVVDGDWRHLIHSLIN